MSGLFEGEAAGNAPEFTVSDIAGAVKRLIEGEFAHVRVRGELSRVSRPASGHLYFDLKDASSVLNAVMWRGMTAALAIRPEEGMEVIATGRLTTYGAQSKYQMIVERLEPAGQGALMLMLEKRRKALEAEGLFAAERKQALPYLPGVIGVVTSPSGAVIRDILHRLADRFPRQVLIWPVVVQGEKCAGEVANAIRGFNAIAPGGPVPRPDVIIVARGGGSIEDLWGFNEEIVVRAAAASAIPLISAIGHETDTTLIDFAADRRAPTPTAAAEMAVPVRAELLASVAALEARRLRALVRRMEVARQRLRDVARGIPRSEALLSELVQRLDHLGQRLPRALRAFVQARRVALGRGKAGLFGPLLLSGGLRVRRDRLADRAARLGPALERVVARQAGEPERWGKALQRALQARLEALRARLLALGRVYDTLGTDQVLKRGFALVRAEGDLQTSRAEAGRHQALEIEFHDGRLAVWTSATERQGRLI